MTKLTVLQQELYILLTVAEANRQDQQKVDHSKVGTLLEGKGVELSVSLPVLLDGLRHAGYLTGHAKLSHGEIAGMENVHVTAKGVERLKTTLKWKG